MSSYQEILISKTIQFTRINRVYSPLLLMMKAELELSQLIVPLVSSICVSVVSEATYYKIC